LGGHPRQDRSSFDLRLRLGVEATQVRVQLPTVPVRVTGVLPALQSVASAVVDAAARRVERQGKAISCRKGCGACCRQPVPVAEAEAAFLAELIGGMAADRQAVLRRRFRRGIRRLGRAGLLDPIRRLGQMPDGDARRRLGLAYFRQQIPCPFLEDESCSIHPHRPLSCREYLVTSPAAHCADPVRNRVERVPIPSKPSVALYRLGDGSGGGKPRWLPLILALEWAEQHPHPAGAAPVPGPRLFEAFLRELSPGTPPR